MCCPKIHTPQPRPVTNGSSVLKSFNTCPYSTVHGVGGTDEHRHPLGVWQRSRRCSRSPLVPAATTQPSIPTDQHPHPWPPPRPGRHISQPGRGTSRSRRATRPRVIVNLIRYFECLALSSTLLPVPRRAAPLQPQLCRKPRVPTARPFAICYCRDDACPQTRGAFWGGKCGIYPQNHFLHHLRAVQ